MARLRPFVVLPLALLAGCQSGPRLAGLNPFHRPERTSIQVPAQQVAAVRDIARQSTGADTQEQRQIVAGLVTALESENDPMLREATLETIAAFGVPQAREALASGLVDADPFVRIKCCKLLAGRADPDATTQLARVLREDANFDVRVAAARSLGQAPEGKPLLVAALQDRDPAMQFVGVEAMKQLTGQDYGGDVSAYLALAQGETPTPSPEQPRVNVAERATGWIPFF